MKALLFDTETTGFVKTPVDTQPVDVQPYLTQLHGVLIEHDDKDYEILETVSTYIGDAFYNGFKIPKKITELTGVTWELLDGKPRWSDWRTTFFGVVEKADTVVTHNFVFDARVIHVQEKRLGFEKPFGNVKHRCTLETSRKVNKLAKSHALGNLYKHLFGETLENAHTADADTMGMLRVYMDLVHKKAWA